MLDVIFDNNISQDIFMTLSHNSSHAELYDCIEPRASIVKGDLLSI